MYFEADWFLFLYFKVITISKTYGIQCHRCHIYDYGCGVSNKYLGDCDEKRSDIKHNACIVRLIKLSTNFYLIILQKFLLCIKIQINFNRN